MNVVNLVSGTVPPPEEGESAVLAHFKAGVAEAIVERYNYRDPDGALSSTFDVMGNWADAACGVANLHLTQEDWSRLDEVIDVLTAARTFIRDEVVRGR